MTIVTKKILPEWYDMIASGKKKFELRLADFDIKDGDILRLEEWVGEGENRKPTGRVIERKVNYIRKVDLQDWVKQQPELSEKGFYILQLDEESEKYDAQRESYGLFFLAIAFAIVGGLAVAILDRLLQPYGLLYGLFVAVLFLVLTFVVQRGLERNLQKRKK
jgi:Flp pilus assembly protein TadB